MGGDLGEFTCGKRWVYIGDNRSLKFASLHGPLLSLSRLSGRISSGACAPKPATEPRSFNEEWLFRLVNYEVLDRENVKSFGLAAF